jgi:hypothetical protein
MFAANGDNDTTLFTDNSYLFADHVNAVLNGGERRRGDEI